MTDARDQIRHLRESYMRCQQAGDAEGCVRHWDADGVLLPPNEPSVKGAEALLSWYRAAFKEFSLDFHLSYDEIQVNGDWSFASGTDSGTVTPKAGGDPIEDSGKFLEIHRRQPDGSWKFARHMWSSDKEGH